MKYVSRNEVVEASIKRFVKSALICTDMSMDELKRETTEAARMCLLSILAVEGHQLEKLGLEPTREDFARVMGMPIGSALWKKARRYRRKQ